MADAESSLAVATKYNPAYGILDDELGVIPCMYTFPLGFSDAPLSASSVIPSPICRLGDWSELIPHQPNPANSTPDNSDAQSFTFASSISSDTQEKAEIESKARSHSQTDMYSCDTGTVSTFPTPTPKFWRHTSEIQEEDDQRVSMTVGLGGSAPLPKSQSPSCRSPTNVCSPQLSNSTPPSSRVVLTPPITHKRLRPPKKRRVMRKGSTKDLKKPIAKGKARAIDQGTVSNPIEVNNYAPLGM